MSASVFLKEFHLVKNGVKIEHDACRRSRKCLARTVAECNLFVASI